ncbi:MAG: PEP-CTERM sorting domain-containing protein [Planctomycetia bacterium]
MRFPRIAEPVFSGKTGSGRLSRFGVSHAPSSLAAVPKPSTYAMALAGLACGGFSIWRRKRAFTSDNRLPSNFIEENVQ